MLAFAHLVRPGNCDLEERGSKGYPQSSLLAALKGASMHVAVHH